MARTQRSRHSLRNAKQPSQRRRPGFRLTKNCLGFESLEDRRMMALTAGTNLSRGTQLTTFTLALATTAELTQAAGGKAATKILLNQLVSELNKTYQSELAISFQLHP